MRPSHLPPQRVSGLVLKRGPKVGSKWQTRWLDLRDHTMSYFKEQNGRQLGDFRLSTVTAFWPASNNVDSPKPELAAFAFALDCQQPDRSVRTFNFCCLTQASYSMWLDALTIDLGNQAIPIRPRNHTAEISGPVISSPVNMAPPARSPRSISLTSPRAAPPTHTASPDTLPTRSKTISNAPPSTPSSIAGRRSTASGQTNLPAPAVRSSVSERNNGIGSVPRSPNVGSSSGTRPAPRAAPGGGSGDRPPSRSNSSAPAVQARAAGVRAAPSAAPPPPAAGAGSPRKPPPPQYRPEDLYVEEEYVEEPQQLRGGRGPVSTKSSGNLPPLPTPNVKKQSRVKGPLPSLPATASSASKKESVGRSASAAAPRKPLPSLNRAPQVVDDFPTTETIEVQSENFMSSREAADSYSDMTYADFESGVELVPPDAEADDDTLEIEGEEGGGEGGGGGAAQVGDVRVALWEWFPDDVETSLPLQPGDRVTILEIEDEWALGTNQDGCQGWFPVAFVVKT